MSDLLAARSQMAKLLAFHIVFAVAGMGFTAGIAFLPVRTGLQASW